MLSLRDGLFLAVVPAAPAPLAEAARARAREDEAAALSRLRVSWRGEPEARGDVLSRALLRVYAEVLSEARLEPEREHRPGYCPFCGGAPAIAVRKPEPETHGAFRALGCGLCGREWPVSRIRCAACGEDDPGKLPVFRDERHPAVRIEACEVCRCYVKSIDLSVDARPVPEVDDLLSISMDLWAEGEGFTRIEPGLAGL